MSVKGSPLVALITLHPEFALVLVLSGHAVPVLGLAMRVPAFSRTTSCWLQSSHGAKDVIMHTDEPRHLGCPTLQIL